MAISLLTIPVWAQSTAHATKSTGSSLSADKSKMLCKAWKLDSLSEYGVTNAAKGKNANDCITFGSNGSFSITLDGTAYTGTWTYSGGRISAVAVSDKDKFSFGIVTLTDNYLVLDYQYPDLTRAQFVYSPKQ